MQIYPYSTTYFCKMEILKIAVIAEDQAFSELEGITGVAWLRPDSLEKLNPGEEADLLLYLKDEGSSGSLAGAKIPVIVNSVTSTLPELGLSGEAIRINGWPGFLRRDLWEYSGNPGNTLTRALEKMGKKTVAVADEPGLVTARVISMIINEAYFALEEEVSTRNEIDIALKLGTNYPYGPFEWSRNIGIKRIYGLLEKLSRTDSKYAPSPLLKQEAMD